MKSNSFTFLSAVVLICLSSCHDKSANKFEKLQKMEWLVGTWEQKLPDGTVTEIWTKENDSTFSGKSYFVKEKDTIHLETIVLSQKIENLLYIPTVAGQNNDEPVTFKSTLEADNTFTFENPTHDYPQKIIYKKISNDRLIATISGKQHGKQTQESYSMTKK